MYQIVLFWNDTLQVSDGLSAHHQEFKTVHTATSICQTDTAVCLLVGTLASRQQYLSDICLLLYVQSSTPDDGRKDRPKHVQCHSKIKQFDTMVHLVGFTIEIYYDAWLYEHQICGACTSAHMDVKHHLPADMRVIFDCFTSTTFFQMTR